jgi:hypothetical protein
MVMSAPIDWSADLCALRTKQLGLRTWRTRSKASKATVCLRAAVVDLLREEGAQGAAAVDARLDLLSEVPHELMLFDRIRF